LHDSRGLPWGSSIPLETWIWLEHFPPLRAPSEKHWDRDICWVSTAASWQHSGRDNWSPHISPKRRAVEITGKAKRCSSWRDIAVRIGNVAATCMCSSPSQLISLALPLQERHWDHDKNVIAVRIRVTATGMPSSRAEGCVLYKPVWQ
jgi:hypothetical protein